MADGNAAPPSFMARPEADDAVKASPQPPSELKIRKEFPECWIYSSIDNEEGLVELTTLCVTFALFEVFS